MVIFVDEEQSNSPFALMRFDCPVQIKPASMFLVGEA